MKSKQITGMTFVSHDGLVPVYKNALRFAGETGRIATIPDLVNLRLNAQAPEDVYCGESNPWSTWYSSDSAEYVGYSRGGNLIIVVAHGAGPLSSLDGILKTYSHEYKDKTRSNRGGRIKQQELWELESGKYGDVSVIEYQPYASKYEFPFQQQLRLSDAEQNPLVRARLGDRYQDYTRRLTEESRKFVNNGVHIPNKRDFDDPFLFSMSGAGYSYRLEGLDTQQAFAHLLTMERVMPTSHGDDDGNHNSLLANVSTSDWGDLWRFVATKESKLTRTVECPSVDGLIRRHWKRVMTPVLQPVDLGFSHILRFGQEWFVEQPKVGDRMDTGEPLYHVSSIKKVAGGPKTFSTSAPNGGFFFKYAASEVRQIAPPGANAYALPGSVGYDGSSHFTDIEFYRITVDTTARLLTEKEVFEDFDLLMSLAQLKSN